MTVVSISETVADSRPLAGSGVLQRLLFGGMGTVSGAEQLDGQKPKGHRLMNDLRSGLNDGADPFRYRNAT